MKRITPLYIAFLLILAFACLKLPLFAQEPISETILENYSITVGATSWGARGVIFDKSFGGGTAKALIVFVANDNFGRLFLRVWRKVRSGEITFALLVFRIEIRGYDALGNLIYVRDLNGFTFGDSSSGHWSQRLQDLPANIGRIRITFFGNYE
jgi:hypothetical protein